MKEQVVHLTPEEWCVIVGEKVAIIYKLKQEIQQLHMQLGEAAKFIEGIRGELGKPDSNNRI